MNGPQERGEVSPFGGFTAVSEYLFNDVRHVIPIGKLERQFSQPGHARLDDRSQRLSGGAESTPLFRPEALEGLRSRHGRPVPLFGVGSWSVVLLMMLALAVVFIFLFSTQFSRKETVQGSLQPTTGAAVVSFPRPARVTRIFVQEGQQVTKGQPLLKLSLDTTLGDGNATLGDRLSIANDRQAGEIVAEIAAMQSSSAAARDAMAARLAGARSQILHLQQSRSLQEKGLRLEEQNFSGLMALQAKGFVSNTHIREKQLRLLEAEQRLSEMDRQIDQLTSEVATMQASIGQSQADMARATAQLRASQAELELRRAQTDAERDAVLVAPYAGTLVTLRVSEGGAVEAGRSLATVLPRGAVLEAVLWVPSKAIGFVSTGDEVRVMFDAFPFERFGTGKGLVTAVSRTPVDASDLPMENQGMNESLYRVRVQLASQRVEAYGRSWPLAPGSKLRADLILDRQSFLDWILDPLKAFRDRAA